MSESTLVGVAASSGTLPAMHEHAWRLMYLDFEHGGVREYRCDGCPSVWFA
jgi:hypothetical protein